MASSLRPKFESPDKKLALLSQFQENAKNSQKNFKSWQKNKRDFKTSKDRTKFNSSWAEAYKRLNETQAKLESSLQSDLMMIDDSEFLSSTLAVLNRNNQERRRLLEIVEEAKYGSREKRSGSQADDGLIKLQEHWLSMESSDFEQQPLEDLDPQDIVPSEVVEICQNCQEDFAAENYLDFVELFLIYREKIGQTIKNIESLEKRISEDQILYSYARVVGNMVPKTESNYIDSRIRLFNLLCQNQKSSLSKSSNSNTEKISALNQIEHLDLSYKNYNKLHHLYKSDKHQLKEKVLAMIEQEVAKVQADHKKIEAMQRQSDYCLQLHAKLEDLRSNFDQSELDKFAADFEVTEETERIIQEEKYEKIRRKELEKARVEKFKTAKRAAQAETSAHRSQQAEQHQREIDSRKPKNLQRTNFRVGLRNEKLKAEEDLKLKNLNAQKKKQANLEKIRDLTRKEMNLHNVKSDETRLVSDTASSKSKILHKNPVSQEYYYVEGGGSKVGDHSGLFPLKTFTSDKVMQDPRLRLQSMLSNAGISLTNDYARTVFANLEPKHARHNVSNLFR